MKATRLMVLAFGTAALTFSACKKENIDWAYGTDNSVAEAMFGDVYGQINSTSEADDNLRNGCTTITFSAALGTFPNTVTIDFGAGCLCDDGRTRKGKIIANYTGRWRTEGTVVTVTTDGYEVNGYKVEGTHVYTNEGLNNSGNMEYSSVVTNGVVTDPTGESAQWNRTLLHEWVAGQNTSFATNGAAGVLDDVWHTTGSGNGVTRNGNAYTGVITEALVHELDCRWYTAGKIDVTPSGGGTARSIDFGDGVCDSKVIIGYGNYTTEVDIVQ